MTVELHADKVDKGEELVADTTVQEANVKFPTDTRLHVDCVEKLWSMGAAEAVSWRRSYVRAHNARFAGSTPCSKQPSGKETHEVSP